MRAIWGAVPAAPVSVSASGHGVEPAEMDRIALAAKERDGFVERQADDVGIGTDDLHQKAAGDALRGVAAGLAAPFAGGEIGLDVFIGEPLETHPGLDM